MIERPTTIPPHTPTRGNGPALMRWGMIACCTVMLLPVAGFFLSGGSLAGLAANASLFAPLVLCLGMHVVMHKVMGKSCHGAPAKRREAEATEAETLVPVEASRAAP